MSIDEQPKYLKLVAGRSERDRLLPQMTEVTELHERDGLKYSHYTLSRVSCSERFAAGEQGDPRPPDPPREKPRLEERIPK